MAKRLLILFLFVIFLNGCTKVPEVNMTNHKGEGYFVGILYSHYKCFIPMEFVLPIHNDMRHPLAYDSFITNFSLRMFFKNNNKTQMKKFSDYDFYFVIVKGEIVDYFPEKSKSVINTDFYLRIDKVVYSKVVDKDFVNCLFAKRMNVKRLNYYLKHPKEILKLCPCKPLKKIKKRDKNIVTL